MERLFSNIIIFTDSNKNIEFVKDKIEKMIIDEGNIISSDKKYDFKVDIIQDRQNNITLISSLNYSFKDIDSNKSIIRKISKRIANDTFMVSSIDNNTAILEKYSFNKRIYDYIVLGDSDKLVSMGYTNISGKYLNKEIWKNHFVGRNTIEDVDKILNEKGTYFNNYEVIVEILKLYGIKEELSTYNKDTNLNEQDKVTLYFNTNK